MNGAYYNQESTQTARQEVFVIGAIALIVGLGIGTIMALVKNSQRKRPLHERLLHSAEKTASKALDTGRDATLKAVESLQSEFERLRKELAERY